MNILKNEVIDKELINNVNQNASLFSIKGNKFFENKTLENVKDYSNTLFSSHHNVD